MHRTCAPGLSMSLERSTYPRSPNSVTGLSGLGVKRNEPSITHVVKDSGVLAVRPVGDAAPGSLRLFPGLAFGAGLGSGVKSHFVCPTAASTAATSLAPVVV